MRPVYYTTYVLSHLLYISNAMFVIPCYDHTVLCGGQPVQVVFHEHERQSHNEESTYAYMDCVNFIA